MMIRYDWGIDLNVYDERHNTIYYQRKDWNTLELKAAQEEYQHVYTSITDLYNKNLTLSYALE